MTETFQLSSLRRVWRRSTVERPFVYLCAVVDWFSRRVLSWKLSITLETAVCLEALEEALSRYERPEIFNTDQGGQFTAIGFIKLLKDAEISISMDGKGTWRDDAFVERLWRSIKYEEAYLHAYKTVSEAASVSAGIWHFTMADAHIHRLT